MKHVWLVLAFLMLAVPAVADDAPKVDVGMGVSLDKGSYDFMASLTKIIAAAAGGGFGWNYLKQWKDGKMPKPQPGPTPEPSPNGKFDPSKLIDMIKDMLDGKTDPPTPGPNPTPLPLPVPTDLQRYLDFVSQTQALHQDIKTKGQPVASDHKFYFADGSAREIEVGSKSIPAPVPVAA